MNGRRALVLFVALMAALTVYNRQWIAGCGADPSEMRNTGMWCLAVTTSLLLMAPSVFSRRLWPSALLSAVTYGVMLANLLYLRTFGSWIPWGSYFAVGNLADFTDAVTGSFEPADVAVPLILAAGFAIAALLPGKRPGRRFAVAYVALLVASACCTAWAFNSGEPLGSKLAELEHNHKHHALAASRYSLPLVTVHEALAAPRLSAKNRREVERVLARRVTDARTSGFRNLVVILLESLEGWTVDLRVDGREVTPVMNSLMADSANLAVPRMLHDTGPGRSIDAQLVLLSGLVPTRDRIFAFAYPGNAYPSVYHAFKQHHPGAGVHSFTTDHEGIYNLGRIAPRLGVDSLRCWAGAPGSGRHGRRARRMADGEFFDRVMAEVDAAAIWHPGGANVLQLATYTCHAPYRPVEGADFPAPEQWPTELRNYMKVTHYTDSVLGRFIDWLRQKPDFGRTLVVIMGDHPTFGPGQRAELAAYVPEIESESVPMVMLNAGRASFTGTARQVDVYPTMIALLGLGDYNWHGVGTPLLPRRPQRPRHPAALSTLILNYNLYRP